MDMELGQAASSHEGPCHAKTGRTQDDRGKRNPLPRKQGVVIRQDLAKTILGSGETDQVFRPALSWARPSASQMAMLGSLRFIE